MTGTLFYSALMTETSSFTNLPTTLRDYLPGLRRGNACLIDDSGEVRAGIEPLFSFAQSRGWDVTAALTCSSSVGGPTLHRDYIMLRDEILEGVRAARPDVVALMLHGAMMSTECEDCEGDILAQVRAIVGPGVPVVVVLDPHAHLTDRMVEGADLLVFMKEYPHTDGPQRLAEALAVAGRMIDQGLRPVPAVSDCRLIGFFPTQDQPMRGFVEGLHAIERRPGVVSASFVHGFPWGDMPQMGSKALVYADGDPALAARTAEEIMAMISAIRDRTMPTTIDVATAVEKALVRRERPLVLADISDNPGGGAPSDSTFILRALIDAGVRDAAVGLVYDPQAVQICHQVGVGARLLLRVGGKTGPASGAPLDLEAEVMGVCVGAEMAFGADWRFPMGDTAWIRADGVDVVLNSIRIQLYHPSGFDHIGLDPAARRTLVVKSSNHFQAFFGDLAGEIAWVGTPGAIDFDFRRLPYRRLTRAMYPLVADPFAEAA